jgi:hypothetical protein
MFGWTAASARTGTLAWAGGIASMAKLATPATLSENRKAASMCLRTFMMVLLSLRGVNRVSM